MYKLYEGLSGSSPADLSGETHNLLSGNKLKKRKVGCEKELKPFQKNSTLSFLSLKEFQQNQLMRNE